MPANIAMEIARAPDGDIQHALAEGIREQIAARQSNPGHSADHSAAQSTPQECTSLMPPYSPGPTSAKRTCAEADFAARGSIKPTSAMQGWAARSWSGPPC